MNRLGKLGTQMVPSALCVSVCPAARLACPGVTHAQAVCVRIEGHCSVGMAPLLAPRLSYSRAEAVRDALLQSQVEATQLELGACGNNVALRAGWSATEVRVSESCRIL